MRIILKNYKIPSWNLLYSGKHWSIRKEMAEYAHISVREALIGKHATMYSYPVKITISAHLKRTIDPDNVCSKLVIDGIKMMGILKDDTPQYVSSVTVRVIKAKEDKTVIDIEKYDHDKR